MYDFHKAEEARTWNAKVQSMNFSGFGFFMCTNYADLHKAIRKKTKPHKKVTKKVVVRAHNGKKGNE